jgi:hypothetical protein
MMRWIILVGAAAVLAGCSVEFRAAGIARLACVKEAGPEPYIWLTFNGMKMAMPEWQAWRAHVDQCTADRLEAQRVGAQT